MSQKTFLKIAYISAIIGLYAGLLGVIGILLDGSDHNRSNIPIYCCSILPIIILLFFSHKRRKNLIILKKIKKSKIKKSKIKISKGEASEMFEFAKRFIDKDCIIYSFDGSQQYGTIKEVTDNAILIEEKGELIAVNLEFIAKIKEYPKNKKGKRKSITF